RKPARRRGTRREPGPRHCSRAAAPPAAPRPGRTGRGRPSGRRTLTHMSAERSERPGPGRDPAADPTPATRAGSGWLPFSGPSATAAGASATAVPRGGQARYVIAATLARTPTGGAAVLLYPLLPLLAVAALPVAAVGFAAVTGSEAAAAGTLTAAYGAGGLGASVLLMVR